MTQNPNCCFPYSFPFPFGPYPGDLLVVLKRILDLELVLTKDDDVTAARVLVCFEKPEVEVKDLLKKYDVIVTVGRIGEKDDIVGDEQLTIGTYNVEIWCVTRSGITGWKLRKKAKTQVKEILKDHAVGSYRKQLGTLDEDVAGSPKLYHTIHTLEYWSFKR